MQELRKIWAFGIPYLKPYRFRFVLGIVLSMFFGLSNGLFVLSVNALFNRLAPPCRCLGDSVQISDHHHHPKQRPLRRNRFLKD